LAPSLNPAILKADINITDSKFRPDFIFSGKLRVPAGYG
jgi:hypothetical protein